MKKYDLEFDDGTTIGCSRFARGPTRIDNRRRYVSFFAVEDCFDFSIRGLPLRTRPLISSVPTIRFACPTRDPGVVAFAKGRLLVIETDDPEPAADP
ncbi:MAG: hypothetical protein MZU97_09685 [Bacillus subtilis]|nr:hypothetical protein [Bacillus subtilis]